MSINQNTKLFIVDDDPFWTEILTTMLNNLGLTNIQTFKSGQDCIANLNQSPCAIFLDYQMEGLNGLEVLKIVNEKLPSSEVVFATSYEDLSVAMEALNNGSCDYVLKTKVTTDELSTIVNRISSKKQDQIIATA